MSAASRNEAFDQCLGDFLRFTGADPSAKVVFFLVMGMTGAGKSTMIQRLTGRDITIGHGLSSCTNDLGVYSFHHEGYHVHMIDTPGFDDTNRSDIDTLKTISSYLSASYANGIRISGVIYLHRISDNRLGGTGLRNLRMFKKLSGSNAWPNVAIGTTMWQMDEYARGEERERELTSNDDFFGDLLAHGAKLFRIAEHGTGEDEQRHSSLRLVSHLIQRSHTLPAIDLKIQVELVDENLNLDETAAGREVLGELYHLRHQLTSQIDRHRTDMHEALRMHDLEAARQLQAMQDDCTHKITESQTAQAELQTSLLEMHEAEVHKLNSRLDTMEASQSAVLASKEQELRDMEISVRHLREQSAIDLERWEKQAVDMAALERKRRTNEELSREAAQSMHALRQHLAAERKYLGSIGKAKGALKGQVVSGLANGLATAATTAIATALIGGLLCVVQ